MLFDRNDRQFDDGALRKTKRKNIQPFFLKSGDSIKKHLNDNAPNAKLEYLYNVAKSVWMMKYGTTKFSP